MEHIKIITYVLDDDREELELLEPYLRDVCGAHLQLYTDPCKFISAIEQGCHLAIIDNHLNGIVSGLDMGTKALDKNPNCFLILFTGNDSRELILKAVNEVGFSKVVSKGQPHCYEQVANIVKKELPRIRNKIAFFHKYKQYE